MEKGFWIWFQEWNSNGNCTTYGGERYFTSKEELQKWLDNYIPNFEGCSLHWDYDEEVDVIDVKTTNEDVINATERIEQIIGEE